MEFIHRMTLDEMQRRYGNNCQFIVIDVNRFGFIPPPRPGITTGTQTYGNPGVLPCTQGHMETPTSTIGISVNAVGTSSETSSDLPTTSTSNQVEGMEVKSETVSDVASMQDYYAEEEHSGNDFDVVVLEEEDGVIIYSGAGTVNDPVVVEYV